MARTKIARSAQNKPDYLLAGLVLLLSRFGLIMIYDISVVLAYEKFGDKFWLLQKQALLSSTGYQAGYQVPGTVLPLFCHLP